jgi:endonuclease/exonuclease/phosphatase family metal-dependent hydrolase
MPLRITVWNAEWALPGSHKGAAIGEILAALEPDLICLTEAVPPLLPPGGHTITSEADYGYPLKPGRRKVLLWSRHPWRDIDSTGHPGLPPGRFVAGLTDSPLGPVRVIGVCIPWARAHVSTGRRDRKPWQDHLSFLQHLPETLNPAALLLLAGDFNQTLPRTRAPRAAASALQTALHGLTTPTANKIPSLDRLLIDHLAHSPHFTTTGIRGIPRHHLSGLPLSDHDGACLTLTTNTAT